MIGALPALRRASLAILLVPVLLVPALLVPAAGPGAAWATLTPSPELSFRVTMNPDSISVGDPIEVVVEAAGPAGATLLLPQLADSVGPFAVLDAGPPVAGTREGKATVGRTVRVTRFRSGDAEFPALALLWVRAPGDTAVAWSSPVPVRVGALLQEPADVSKLHDLKPVVALARPRWWLWGAVALAALALAFAAWRYRHLLRRRRAEVTIPAPPPLPPEIAFDRGLQALVARRLPEAGRVKEYYGELSLLFRRYIEDRFAFPAVEETRREILVSVQGRSDLRSEESAALGEWLLEDEMVKFARMDRLLGEVASHTERARAWVKATTPVLFAQVYPPALPPSSPAAPPPSSPAAPPPSSPPPASPAPRPAESAAETQP